jgi:hypothetical protein
MPVFNTDKQVYHTESFKLLVQTLETILYVPLF